MHPDGYIQLKDRSKDIIISGGENISSIEVEDALYKHPAVASCGVVARPDEKWGETPVAYVELKPGKAATEEEIIEHCRTLLARFKCPKAVIFAEIPKTSTGKIQKFRLRELAKAARLIASSGDETASAPIRNCSAVAGDICRKHRDRRSHRAIEASHVSGAGLPAIIKGFEMQGVARNFFTLAIIYALCGMALGLHMSISQDHAQMPVHAHTMVAGWLMSAVFAFFYHLFPAVARFDAGARPFLADGGERHRAARRPVFPAGGKRGDRAAWSAVSSMVFYAAMLLFAFIALPAIYRT